MIDDKPDPKLWFLYPFMLPGIVFLKTVVLIWQGLEWIYEKPKRKRRK